MDKIFLTTTALIFNSSHSTFQPPINRSWNTAHPLMHEALTSTWRPSEHPVVLNLWASIHAPKLMVSHVSKLVQFQLIRLIQLVGVMNMHNIFLEHIEALVLLIKTRWDRMVAPPPLIQIPYTFLRIQILLMKIESLSNPKKGSK